MGHILESLVGDTIEGMMMGKATRGRKQVQTLSDVISKTYSDLKRKLRIGVDYRRDCHKLATARQKTEET